MKPKPSVDLYTAEDHLTPEKFEELKKELKERFKREQPLYSENDLFKAFIAGRSVIANEWNTWIKAFRKN